MISNGKYTLNSVYTVLTLLLFTYKYNVHQKYIKEIGFTMKHFILAKIIIFNHNHISPFLMHEKST